MLVGAMSPVNHRGGLEQMKVNEPKKTATEIRKTEFLAVGEAC